MKVSISEILNAFKGLKDLNPKEYYSWPLPAQIIIGFFSLILVVFLFYMVNLSDMQAELENLSGKEEDLKKSFIEKKRQAVNLKLYEQQLEDIKKDSDALLKQLPDKSQMEKLLIDINQAAVSRGLRVELFRPNQEKMEDFYAVLPIDIKVFGTFEAVGQFTAAVSQLSRVVIFSTMEMNLEKNNNITLSAVVKTFRYLDKEEIEEVARIEAEKKKKEKKAGNNQQQEKPKGAK